jgi:hypothetical protein
VENETVATNESTAVLSPQPLAVAGSPPPYGDHPGGGYGGASPLAN